MFMELFILVNAEKHKAKRKVASEDLLQELDYNIIKILNENPEGVIKELTVNNNELERLYNKMQLKEGSVLASSECSTILNYIFRTDYSLEAIKLNYHAIKLEASVIDSVKNLCYEALDIFQKIQELQQVNLNDSKYLGLDSVIAVEMLNNPEKPIEYYSSEEFLELINLKQTYKTKIN